MRPSARLEWHKSCTPSPGKLICTFLVTNLSFADFLALQASPQAIAPMSDQRRAVCRDLFANLSAYLDGRVERVTCRQVRAHIETCPSCVAFLRGLRGAVDRCRFLEVPCDPAVAPRLRAIFTREYPRRPVMPAAN